MQYTIEVYNDFFKWVLLAALGAPWIVYRFGWWFTSTDTFWTFLGKHTHRVWFAFAFLFDLIIKGTLVYIALSKLL